MIGKISGFTPVKPSTAVKKRGNVSSSSFSDFLDAAGVDDAAPARQLSDVSAISTMLSLQEISEEDLRRKKLVQQGKNMIDVLEDLRRRLLAGAIPGHMLIDLERQLSVQKQSVADPRLTEIIDDIEIRLAVELAKLEKARNDKNNIDQ